jgi:tetratricopeptide (TPR) repeat protein
MSKLFLAIHALVVVIVVGALSPATHVLAAAQASGSRKEGLIPETSTPTATDSPLDPSLQLQLKGDLQRADYKDAEKLLLAEAERDPKSIRAARLLSIAGGIFFLDQQYPESVNAWKKSEAIAPLDDRSRFTRAMAYIYLSRRDLALPELKKLTAAQPENPLYLYWLARLDYDRRDYNAAINKFQKVIALDPKMGRAYDILGFCHEYVGKGEDAINDFHRAIELNQQQAKPSPWPLLDFAVVLTEQNRLEDAEKNLREAIEYGPRLPQAHFQLGRVLEKQNREQEAIEEFQRAAELDERYPDPHYQLGRLYRKQGKKQLSEEQINQFLLLKRKKNGEMGAVQSQDPSIP